MDLGLKNKISIVTGASRGIGRECAIELAKEGSTVLITARNEELLSKTVSGIEKEGGNADFVSADLSNHQGCKSVVDTCIEKFGSVDILVNCAGAAKGGDILDLDVSLIDDALGLKSYGYLRLAQMVIPYMKKKKWGRIVNVAGGAGTSPTRRNIPPSLANITILNMPRAISDAVAGEGILINTVCPGMTNTQRARDIYEPQAKKEGRDVEDILSKLGSSLPAGRICEPEEVGPVVAFLSSEKCSYVFGSSIYMDGGARRSTP